MYLYMYMYIVYYKISSFKQISQAMTAYYYN